jgi:hypothetical protein
MAKNKSDERSEPGIYLPGENRVVPEKELEALLRDREEHNSSKELGKLLDGVLLEVEKEQGVKRS